jgi:hypothetical protein
LTWSISRDHARGGLHHPAPGEAAGHVDQAADLAEAVDGQPEGLDRLGVGEVGAQPLDIRPQRGELFRVGARRRDADHLIAEPGHGVEDGGAQPAARAAHHRDQPPITGDDSRGARLAAALDAFAEHSLFERYATSAGRASREVGGVTVLVSHRFSTVLMADLIAVLEHGRLVEFGSHRELMAVDGLHAELFRLQARAYGA